MAYLYSESNNSAVQALGCVSPQLLQHLWEGLSHGLFVLDVEEDGTAFRYSAFNPAIARMSLIPVDQLLGKTLTEALPPDLAHFYGHHYRACVESGATITFEQSFQWEEQECWWFLTVSPLAQADGQVIQLAVTVMDMSDRKAAEMALQQRYAFLQGVIEHTTDAIFAKDQQHRYVLANPTTLSILGRSEAEVIGKTDQELLPLDIAQTVYQVDRQVMSSGIGAQFEEVVPNRAGILATYLTTKTPLRDRDGTVIGLVGIARDISDRKATEESLQENRRRLQMTLNATRTGIWDWTVVTDELHLSEEAERLFGFSPGAFQGSWQACIDVMHPNDVNRVERAIQRALAGEVPYAVDYRVRWPDQSVHWLSDRGEVLRDEQGRAIAMVGTLVDITHRKTIEEALRQSEERFQSFMDHSPTAVWIVSQDGEMLYTNKTYLEMFTVPQDIVGKNLLELYPTEVANEFLQNIRSVVKRQELLTTVEPIPLPDGTMGDTLVYKFPVADISGRAVVGGIAIDITDRKRAEAALQDYAERQSLLVKLANQIRNSLNLDTVIETTIQAVYHLLEIDYCSFSWFEMSESSATWEITQEAKLAGTASLCGVHPMASIGHIVSKQLIQQQIIQVDNVAYCYDPIFQSFLRRLEVQSALLIPIRTHSQRNGCIICAHHQQIRPWVENEVALLKAVGDQLAIAIDQAELYDQTHQKSRELEITLQELRRTQSQIVQSEKMSSLGQLVAGIAHEINNPVNFIHGNLSHAKEYTRDLLNLVGLYQQEYPSPVPAIADAIEAIDLEFLQEDLPKLLHSMNIGTERIREIVKSLRLFSRLDEAEVKPVNIHEGLDSTLMILHNRIKAKSNYPEIQVIKHYGALPLVECYAGQLNQVFMNILANAIDALEESAKFTPTGSHTLINPAIAPTITIQTALVGTDQVQITIADNGPGMSEAVIQQIFDPFFTTKPIGKGTGMGMSISHQIVTEKHKGTLECVSTLGEGTQFLIQIPIHQH